MALMSIEQFNNTEQLEIEGTHRVQTHAVLLVTLTMTFQPKTMPLVTL